MNPNFRIPVMALAAAARLIQAQEAEDVDSMLARAQKLGTQKAHRAEAMALCRTALVRSPDYHDIRILLARMLSWDGRYDEARQELGYVLQHDPTEMEAREALCDVESWSDHDAAALQVCDAALAIEPDNPTFLYRKARIQKALKNYPAAIATLKQLLAKDPKNYDGRRLLGDVRELVWRNKLTVGATYDHFSNTFTPWWMNSVALSHHFDRGTVIATLYAGTHFDEYGRQLMLEVYPRIVSGTWLYLNYAVSRDPIFPSVSYGAELYHSLPKGFECSLGERHLQYVPSVDIYTGTIAKYVGNYYLILRGNYIPSSVGPTHSGSLTTRRYFGDPDSWVSVVASDGLSPTQSNPAAAVVSLNSRYLELDGQFKIAHRYFVIPSLAYEQDEITPGSWRDDVTVSLSLALRF